MRNIVNIKPLLLSASFIFAALFGLSSCNYNKTSDTKDVAEEQNEAKFDNNKQEKDADFLVDAAEISLEEITLSKLAQEKAATSDVKQLAREMQIKHEKSLADLKTLANSKMVSIPTTLTDDGNDAIEKLNDKSGTEFDKEYADVIVNNHKEAIKEFEKAANESMDPDIRTWASSSLPELRNHLDKSMDIQKKVENL